MTKNCKQPCAAQHSSRVYAGVTQPCPPSLAHPTLPNWPGPTSLTNQPCPPSRTWCAGPRKEGLPSTPRHTRLPGHPVPGPLITLVPPGHSMPSSQDPTWHPDQATHCPLNTLYTPEHPAFPGPSCHLDLAAHILLPYPLDTQSLLPWTPCTWTPGYLFVPDLPMLSTLAASWSCTSPLP